MRDTINWEDLDAGKFAIWSNLYYIVTNVLLYPADLLATRLQADRFMPHHNLKLLRIAREIQIKEGLKGLYRGFGTSLVASQPGQYLYFITYEMSNQILRDKVFGPNSQYSWVSNGMAGIIAEGVSALVYLPADLVIQRLQVARSYSFLPYRIQDRSSLGIVRRLVKTEGLRGLLRGYWPYVATFGPDSAVWWMSYEYLKKRLSSLKSPEEDKASTDWGVILASSAVAGLLSTFVISPFDVARTRLQLLEVSNIQEKSKLRQGFFSILKEIYRNEGLHGLYKGIKPRMYISIPVSTISLVGYEYLKLACKKD
jgi:solute carrier family 25, member 44